MMLTLLNSLMKLKTMTSFRGDEGATGRSDPLRDVLVSLPSIAGGTRQSSSGAAENLTPDTCPKADAVLRRNVQKYLGMINDLPGL
jgi:hypothetical protein